MILMAHSAYSDSPLVLHLNEPCGRIFCGPGWERTRENSLNLRDWELWLVWRGSGWMRTYSGTHPLFAGFCALMRPGGIYDAGHDEADPLGITFIHFDIERGADQQDDWSGQRDKDAVRGGSGMPAAGNGIRRSKALARGSKASAAGSRAMAARGKAVAVNGKTASGKAVSGAVVDSAARRVVSSRQQPLRIDSEPASWPEFFLLDDIEYADLLTSRIISLLDENLPAAGSLLHAFLMDLLEREPIAGEGWEHSADLAGLAAPVESSAAGSAKEWFATEQAVAATPRRLPHYRELRQLFARLRTTSPEALPGVAQMAAQAGLSPEHFSRLFRRVNGQSPMQFIVSLRITHARHLLRESSLSVGEIADRLGYADVYFFSRQFKEQTGVSPLAYRKQG